MEEGGGGGQGPTQEVNTGGEVESPVRGGAGTSTRRFEMTEEAMKIRV